MSPDDLYITVKIQEEMTINVDPEVSNIDLTVDINPDAIILTPADELNLAIESQEIAVKLDNQMPEVELTLDSTPDIILYPTSGLTGPPGPPGPEGPAGPQGSRGYSGEQGIPGPPGADSTVPGPSGPTGPQGIKGDEGSQGPAGTTGQQGPPGSIGQTGQTGAQGLQGIQGVKGDTGATGPVGPTGADSTVPGPMGPSGPMGTVYDSDQIGTIKSWTGKTIPDNWVVASGQILPESGYPDLAVFAAVEQAAGNPLWVVTGVAPNRTIKVPDLTGKFVYAANASLSDIGGIGGEAAHKLVLSEMASHSHGGATGGGNTGTESTDHTHSGTTGGRNIAHTHGHGWNYIVTNSAAGSGNAVTGIVTPPGGTVITQTDYESSDHQHAFTTGGRSAAHTHSVPALSIAAEGGNGTHNNLPPYVLVAQIVKVKGAQIDSAGALVGQTGPQGSQGVKGDTGTTGATGPTGPQGPAGSLVGAPIPWLVSAIPSGYLEFNGQAITQAAYPQLYVLFGATLPDLRGNYLMGQDGGHPVGGAVFGEASHVLTVAEMPSHDHAPMTAVGYASGPGGSAASNLIPPHNNAGAGVSLTLNMTAKGGNAAHNNLPPSRAVRWITAAA